MQLLKKDDKTDYIELMERIEANIFSLDVVFRLGFQTLNCVALRHDVDYSIDHALEFGKVEAEHGIRSTYFLLSSEKYFDYSPAFADKCRELVAMGHSIGWHNNAIAEWIRDDRKLPLPEYIGKPLDFFRANDIEVIGTASHGDKLCRELTFTNYEVWTECPKSSQGKVENIPQYPLRYFGLQYEAYFLPRHGYLSDSGSRWLGGIGQEIAPFEVLGEKDSNIPRTTIARFNQEKKGVLQILIHPCWWEIV